MPYADPNERAKYELGRRSNPQRIAQRRACAQRRRQDPTYVEYNQENRLKHRYRIGGVHYELMLATQGGKCAICRTDPAADRAFHVDHNHSTGDVRGLLCGTCNSLLGRLREDPEDIARGVDPRGRKRVGFGGNEARAAEYVINNGLYRY